MTTLNYTFYYLFKELLE